MGGRKPADASSIGLHCFDSERSEEIALIDARVAQCVADRGSADRSMEGDGDLSPRNAVLQPPVAAALPYLPPSETGQGTQEGATVEIAW